MTALLPTFGALPRLSARRDIDALRSPRGLHASAGDLFVDALFGRDAAEAAEDLLEIRADLAREVIIALAQLQGTQYSPDGDKTSEEEPGRIHHEARSLYVGGRRIAPATEKMLSMLSERWGGTAEQVVYYGAVDATPLFVRLVSRYCEFYGRGFLDVPVVNKDGLEIRLRDSVLAAVGWITGRISMSPLGMVEFRRRNPRGIAHQTWKDSTTSYIHLDGTLANHDQPIASVEVQGLAYDALRGAADLFTDLPDEASGWRAIARRLRDNVLTTLWLTDEEYPALGLDRDSRGRARLIRTISSNGATLLDTGIFDELPEKRRRHYIEQLVRRVCGPEFMTDAGVRCRSLRHLKLVPFQDYHGSETVWPKESYDIAKGLRRQGFERLAAQLEARILNSVNIAGKHSEFFYVTSDGQVGYETSPKRVQPAGFPGVIAGTNVPDQPQLWTVSAALAIKYRLGASLTHQVTALPSSQWQWDLESDVLRGMPTVVPLRTRQQLTTARDDGGWFSIDTDLGRDREAAVIAAYGRRRGLRWLLHAHGRDSTITA